LSIRQNEKDRGWKASPTKGSINQTPTKRGKKLRNRHRFPQINKVK